MTATADVMAEAINRKDALDSGRELVYENDAWLPTPEVYYHPQMTNLRFKVQHSPPRLPEQFVAGRFVAYTMKQREAVRRVLGQNADRWMGDDLAKERTCHHFACSFATKNEAAFEDHETYTERHAPQPDLSAYYR